MKKRIVVLLAFCFLISITSITCARPAPNLSQITITHVGADITGWKTVKEAKGLTLYGQHFYLAAAFKGYPDTSTIAIYSDGERVPPSEITMPFGKETFGSPVEGFIYQWKMPIQYGNGRITVAANGVKGGIYYGNAFGIKSEYKQ